MDPGQRKAVDKALKDRAQVKITDSEAFTDAIEELQEYLDEAERDLDHVRTCVNTLLQLAGVTA